MAGAQGTPIARNEIIDVIRHACLDKVFCRVSLVNDESRTSVAKFLYTEHLDDGMRDLQITVPADIPEPNKLEPLHITFDYDERGMYFVTEFRQKMVFREKNRKPVDSWRIRFPETIYTMQRRGFFRVTADLNDPCRISIEIPGEEEDENPDIIGEMESFDEISGLLWDISGGGLSFTLELAPTFPLTQGTLLNLKMHLPHTDGVTQLPGRVVFIKERPDGDKVYSVQFTNIDTSLDNKHAQNNVLTYVAEREREILSSTKSSKRPRTD